MCWYIQHFYSIVKTQSPLTHWDNRSNLIAMVFMFGPSRWNTQPVQRNVSMSPSSHRQLTLWRKWPFLFSSSIQTEPLGNALGGLWNHASPDAFCPWGKEPQNVTEPFKQQQKDGLPGMSSRAVTKSSTTPSMYKSKCLPFLLSVKISTWK